MEPNHRSVQHLSDLVLSENSTAGHILEQSAHLLSTVL